MTETAFYRRAKALVELGLHVIPLAVNGKVPVLKGWQSLGTRDLDQVQEWGSRLPDANVGVCTGYALPDGASLVVVDVDVKGKVNGWEWLLSQELAGNELPDTLRVETPSGGSHIFLRVNQAVGNSAGKIAPGVDIRGAGGQVVGIGSKLDNGVYTIDSNTSEIADCPEWLVKVLTKAAPAPAPIVSSSPVEIDSRAALRRATQYLLSLKPVIEGNRNNALMVSTRRVRDFGVDLAAARELLLNYWEAVPPLPEEEMLRTINSAWKNCQTPVGSAAPESVFEPVAVTPKPEPTPPVQPEELELSPLEEVLHECNKRFAVITSIRRVAEYAPNGLLMLHPINQVQQLYSNLKWTDDEGRSKSVLKYWLEWEERREYTSMDFYPEGDAPPGVMNIWKGFPIKAAESSDHPGVKKWVEMAMEVFGGGDERRGNFMIDYLAHIFQKPWEKPTISPTVVGGKGTGKGRLLEPIQKMLGGMAYFAAHENSLKNHFNGHLEGKLLIINNEATFAGDKGHAGYIKSLIGDTHLPIEHKGVTAYMARSLMRIITTTNEYRSVPVEGGDERRFVYLPSGTGYQNDIAAFKELDNLMRNGGVEALMKFFLERDLSNFSPFSLPEWNELEELLENNSDPFIEWAREYLEEGVLPGPVFDSVLKGEGYTSNELYHSYLHFSSGSSTPSRYGLSQAAFSRRFKRAFRSVHHKVVRIGTATRKAFTNLDRAAMAKDFKKAFGMEVAI